MIPRQSSEEGARPLGCGAVWPRSATRSNRRHRTYGPTRHFQLAHGSRNDSALATTSPLGRRCDPFQSRHAPTWRGRFVVSGETAGDSHEVKGVVLQGRVIDKVLNAGTVIERHFIALEREPGGQFLAFHHAKDSRNRLDLGEIVGRWVEVEGDIWFQSLTARSIVEIADSSD